MYYYLALDFVNKSNFIYIHNIGTICVQDYHFMNRHFDLPLSWRICYTMEAYRRIIAE